MCVQVEAQRANPLVFLVMKYPWLGKLPMIGWLAEGQYRANSAKVMQSLCSMIDAAQQRQSLNNIQTVFAVDGARA